MGFKSDLEETIKLIFKIGQIWLKSSSGKLFIRNSGDTNNASLVCHEIEVSGDAITINSDATNVGSDRSVRIQRSPIASASYTLVLPPNPGAAGNKVVLSAPGILNFEEDSDGGGGWNSGSQLANNFLAGPVSGEPAAPNFRQILIQDLPTIPPEKGGTGLSLLGSPGQSIRINASGNGFEFYTPGFGFVEEEENMLNRVLYKDANWGLYDYSGQNFFWRSRDTQYLGSGGENATGAIEFGYLVLSNFLHLFVGGGGGTNGSLKRVKIIKASDSSILINQTLSSLIGRDTNGVDLCTINTSAYNGIKIIIRVEDNDPNFGWSWVQVDPKSSFVRD